jgi:hypothetical protein
VFGEVHPLQVWTKLLPEDRYHTFRLTHTCEAALFNENRKRQVKVLTASRRAAGLKENQLDQAKSKLRPWGRKHEKKSDFSQGKLDTMGQAESILLLFSFFNF